MQIWLISQDMSLEGDVHFMLNSPTNSLMHYTDISLATAALDLHNVDVILFDEKMNIPLTELKSHFGSQQLILIKDNPIHSNHSVTQDVDVITLPLEASELNSKLGLAFEKQIKRDNLNLHQLVGETIGNYKIESRLGDKTLDTVVYRAYDMLNDRNVALKFFTKAHAEENVFKRFKREASIATKLNHKNIYKVYGIEEFNSHVMYLAMEFIEGETLKNIMDRTRLSLSQTLNYARQITEGLSIAHEKKITHRDMKPSNIMVSPDGQIKIVDFGIAKALEPTSSLEEPLTKHGMILGTMRYMAPEQIEGRKVDARADCWALGVIFYEMLTGRHPFNEAQGVIGMISAVLHQEPKALDVPNLPQALEEIIGDLLQKDADKRYASALEVLEDLDALRDEA